MTLFPGNTNQYFEAVSGVFREFLLEVFVVFGRFRWRGGFDCFQEVSVEGRFWLFREVSVEGRFWLFSGGSDGGEVLVVFGRFRWRFWLFSLGFGGGFGYFREVSVEVLVIFGRFQRRFWLFSGGFDINKCRFIVQQ